MAYQAVRALMLADRDRGARYPTAHETLSVHCLRIERSVSALAGDEQTPADDDRLRTCGGHTRSRMPTRTRARHERPSAAVAGTNRGW